MLWSTFTLSMLQSILSWILSFTSALCNWNVFLCVLLKQEKSLQSLWCFIGYVPETSLELEIKSVPWTFKYDVWVVECHVFPSHFDVKQMQLQHKKLTILTYLWGSRFEFVMARCTLTGLNQQWTSYLSHTIFYTISFPMGVIILPKRNIFPRGLILLPEGIHVSGLH